MSNSLLQKLRSSGDHDLVKLILEEFPDQFDYGRSKRGDGSKRDNRISSCIDKAKSDLIVANSVPLLNPPSDFETLPELKRVSRGKEDILTFIPSLPLRTDLVLQCHAVLTTGRLPILPAEFLNHISALAKEHFIIVCAPIWKFFGQFGRIYALYRSSMVAANCHYFSHDCLAPNMRGENHRQGGVLDLFPLPQLNMEIANDLEKSGRSLYEADKNAIQLSQAKNSPISVEDLCNPDPSSPSGVLLQQIDKTIDSLYDFSGCPKNFDPRQWALLKLYAHKTQLLHGLNLL